MMSERQQSWRRPEEPIVQRPGCLGAASTMVVCSFRLEGWRAGAARAMQTISCRMRPTIWSLEGLNSRQTIGQRAGREQQGAFSNLLAAREPS